MPILFHTVLVTLHLVAVAVGLGAALLADWIAFRLVLAETVPPTAPGRLHDLSKGVTVGVVLLWASGAVLVWFDASASPTFLLNQKVWAKVVIVASLTLNAVLLHRVVLPLVSAQAGRPLFEHTTWGWKMCCTFAASVSLVSWASALLLGVARELNEAVTMGQVLMAYGAALGITWLGSLTIAMVLPLAPRWTLRRLPP